MAILENSKVMVKGAITSLIKNEINNYGMAMFILRAQVNTMSNNQKIDFAKWLKKEKYLIQLNL